MYNNHCFSTATMVTRTRLNVTLHAHCLKNRGLRQAFQAAVRNQEKVSLSGNLSKFEQNTSLESRLCTILLNFIQTEFSKYPSTPSQHTHKHITHTHTKVQAFTSNWRLPRILRSSAHHTHNSINLLKNERNLLYIRNQSVPRCKHFPPRL